MQVALCADGLSCAADDGAASAAAAAAAEGATAAAAGTAGVGGAGAAGETDGARSRLALVAAVFGCTILYRRGWLHPLRPPAGGRISRRDDARRAHSTHSSMRACRLRAAARLIFTLNVTINEGEIVPLHVREGDKIEVRPPPPLAAGH